MAPSAPLKLGHVSEQGTLLDKESVMILQLREEKISWALQFFYWGQGSLHAGCAKGMLSRHVILREWIMG